ncbi:MAG TPA: glycoside hydrolase family 140 protein [Gemmataceae bacterium]
MSLARAMRFLCLLACGALPVAPARAHDLPRLKVSDNKRFLVKEDGSPFFYLGDTAWELFHRLNREDADRYLRDRAAKRFTVIQAVVLAELDGLKVANAYGHLPLKDGDPRKPNEDYFKHVDWIVDRAEALGLYVGMLPTWGEWVNRKVLTPANAEAYGDFLGRRYKDKAIIWILGGDRAPDSEEKLATYRALAAGLRKGDGGRHLMTYHPPGGASSANWLHNENWLDFNMQQNGHDTERRPWEPIGRDYDRKPTKPVFDGEPLYEDHPIAFRARDKGYSNAADIRKIAYWGVFAGGHGYTYGNHAVWQMYAPKRDPVNGPLTYWYDALNHPGARQVRHLRDLMESRPVLTRIPDQSLLASDASSGSKRIQATRDADGRYAMIYVPASRTFAVHMDKIKGGKVKAWWYSPRTGKAESAGIHPASGTHSFTPPDEGENIDWVLVLDDETASFPPPGTVAKERK